MGVIISARCLHHPLDSGPEPSQGPGDCNAHNTLVVTRQHSSNSAAQLPPIGSTSPSIGHGKRTQVGRGGPEAGKRDRQGRAGSCEQLWWSWWSAPGLLHRVSVPSSVSRTPGSVRVAVVVVVRGAGLTCHASLYSLWIALSSSVILFNKWILSTAKFGMVPSPF